MRVPRRESQAPSSLRPSPTTENDSHCQSGTLSPSLGSPIMIAVVRLAPVALALGAIVALAVGPASATRTRVAAADLTAARAFAVQVAVPGQAGGSAAPGRGTTRRGRRRRLVRLPLGRLGRQRGLGHLRRIREPRRRRRRRPPRPRSRRSRSSAGTSPSAPSPPRQGPRRARRSRRRTRAAPVVTGLVVQGQAVTPGVGTSFPLGDWGSVVTLQQGLTSLDTKGSPGTRAFVTGVQVTLSADHYGYPAGTVGDDRLRRGGREGGDRAEAAVEPQPQVEGAAEADEACEEAQVGRRRPSLPRSRA